MSLNFYVLVVNNLLENIEQYRLPSLNFLNKQHNLYYVLETNINESFRGINDFKSYVIKECQKITNYNSDKLYGEYTKISHFKDEKLISKQYK